MAALAALLSSACLVVSLQPVYEPDTIAFDPGLLGTWVMGDDGVTLTVERGAWHSYHVTIDERDDRMRLSARLTRVGERTYLDAAPLDGLDLPALVLPVHAIYRCDLKGDELALSDLNYEALERQAREGKATLPLVVDARRNVVITAGTAELRRWLVANAADETLFDPPLTFTRRAPLAPAASPLEP
jgi:hypothetical protein